MFPGLEDAMQYREAENFDIAILDVHLNGKMFFPFRRELEGARRPLPVCHRLRGRGVPKEFRHTNPAKAVRTRNCGRALMDMPARGEPVAQWKKIA